MRLNDNKGSVLLITTFIILLSSILVIGFLDAAATDIEISRNHKSDVIVTYIADAGVEAAIYDLLNSGDGNITRTEFPDTVENSTYYTVTKIERAGTIHTIRSLGEYGNFQRTIEAKIRIRGSSATLQYWKEI